MRKGGTRRELDLWTAFCRSLNAGITDARAAAPLTFEMEDKYLSLLCDVRDNCDEVADTEDEEVCRREDVTITQDGARQ